MPDETSKAVRPPAATARSIGRRALLGIGLLALMSGGTAALLYNALEPGMEFAADPEAVRRRDLLAAVTSWSRVGEFSDADLPKGVGNPATLLAVSSGALMSLMIATAQQRVARFQAANDDGIRRPVLATMRFDNIDSQSPITTEIAMVDALQLRGVDGLFIDCKPALMAARSAGKVALDQVAEALAAIATRVRFVDPGFLIVVENAAELTTDARVARIIDGVAHDALLYAADGGGVPNDRTTVARTLGHLSGVKRSGRAVFITEYLGPDNLATRAGALQVLRGLNFVTRFEPG